MSEQMRIYLVDDNQKVLRALSTVFAAAGFEVHSYSSATIFLGEAHEIESAAVLLDLQMPEVDGLKVLKSLHKKYPTLPVIIYSGHADVDTTVQAFADGAFTLIQKPVSNSILVDKVEKAILESRAKESQIKEQHNAKQKLDNLTSREFEIALLLSEGKSAPAIGEQIHLSPRTIETHRNSIFKKLEIKSAAELSRLITLSELDD